MAIDKILSRLRVDIPRPTGMILSPYTGLVPNLNPACGPAPFSIAMATTWLPEPGAVFEARLQRAFIEAQFLSRGRPHFTMLHVALIDDAIAAAALTGVSGECYGKKQRMIEFGVGVAFHREVFPRGSLKYLPRGTIEVDEFRVRWQILPYKDRISVLNRGIFRISILGIVGGEEIPVASVEGAFMRRKAVHPAVLH